MNGIGEPRESPGMDESWGQSALHPTAGSSNRLRRPLDPTDVCVVIPSYRRPDLVRTALEALLAGKSKPGRIIVVEDSSDVDATKEACRGFEQVVLISNGRNEGFASSASQGLAVALEGSPRYAVVGLVNTDVVVASDWLQPLLDVLGEFDFVVPRMIQQGDVVDGDGDVLTRGGAGHRVHRGWTLEAPVPALVPIAYPTGGAALVHRDVWLDVGLFDTRLHMYYEDVDWGLRALAKGYRGRCVTSSVVRHEGHASAGRGMAVAASYRNYLIVALSRLPAPYFRRAAPHLARSVVTGFIYAAKTTSLGEAVRALVRAIHHLSAIGTRRREIHWSPEDENYLMRLMSIK